MKLLKIIFNLFMAAIFASVFSSLADAHVMAGSVDLLPGIITAGLFVFSFVPLPVGSFFMGTYVQVDVPKTGTNPGKGGDKKDTIIVFKWNEVLSGYLRDGKGIRITTDLIFKAGAYMSTIYATQNTIKAGNDSEGEPDAESITQTVEFSHPGDDVTIEEFKANWLSENVGIIIQKCSSTRKKLYGAPCAPLKLVWKAMDDEKSNTSVLTFKSSLGGPAVAEYEGTLAFSSVTDTVAADADEIDLTNGEGRYQLTDGTVASVEVETCSNQVDGIVFTVLGSGGTFPSTITDGTDFMVANGTTWTAIAGATITFRVFKTGVATYKYIEVSRT